MAALLAREKHGFGTVIETSLAAAGMNAFGFKFFGLVTIKESGSPFRTGDGQDIDEAWQAQKANWFSSEDTPDVQLKKLSNGLRAYWSHPFAGFYRCADGRQVNLFFPDFKDKTKCFLKALGIYQTLQQEGFVNEGAFDTKLDNNLSNYPLMNDARKQRLNELITETLLTKKAKEWEALLGEIVPIAMVRTREEYLSLDPPIESGVLTKMTQGESTLTVPSRFVDMSGPGDTFITTYREAEPITVVQADELFKKDAASYLTQSKPQIQKKATC